MTWHVDTEIFARYAGGSLDEARAASIEAHLVACATCRDVARAHRDPERHERAWLEIRDGVDRPRARFFEWLLVRLGARQHVARLVSATPALTASWLAAVAVALGWALVAAHNGDRGVLLFLVIAPLIPLAGVAAAYGPGIDPTYEIGVASPLRGLSVLMLRAGTVLATTIALTGLASLGLPAVGWKAAAWLVPALAVALTSLALSTWMHPGWAAFTVGFVWVSATAAGAARAHGVPMLDRSIAFRPAGQAVLAIVIALAAIVIAIRSETFDAGRQE